MTLTNKPLPPGVGERRSQGERRSGGDRHQLSPFEAHCLRVCRRCNSRFTGIQRGWPELRISALVLFQDSHDSTLAVKIENFSKAAVRAALLKSENRWRESDRRKREEEDRQADVVHMAVAMNRTLPEVLEAIAKEAQQSRAYWQQLCDTLIQDLDDGK